VRGGRVGVVGAKGRLADRQRPLILHPSASQIPKLLQRAAKCVPALGDLPSLSASGETATW
jgi:hypothetical protein